MKRFDFVDAIKGFAIILMVMGHVLACMFADWHVVIKNDPTPSYLWYVIYSFHMPLLMMSGFLFGQKLINGSFSYLKILQKKLVALMIPYLVAGLLLYAYRGGSRLEYWYLGTLFQLVVLFGFVQFVLARYVREGALLLDLVIIVGLWMIMPHIILFIAVHPSISQIIPGIHYLRLGNLYDMILPFGVGVLIAKYNLLEKVTGRAVAFGGLFVFMVAHVLRTPWSEICKWAALFGFLSLFKLYFQSGRIIAAVRYCGKMSMAIYVFHFFFTKMFKFPSVGEWFCDFVQRKGTLGILATIPLQFVYSLALSVILIALCLLVERIVDRIPVFRTLLLGRIGWRGSA